MIIFSPFPAAQVQVAGTYSLRGPEVVLTSLHALSHSHDRASVPEMTQAENLFRRPREVLSPTAPRSR